MKTNLEKQYINYDFMYNNQTNYIFRHPFTKNRTIPRKSSSANAFQKKTMSKVKQMKINKKQKKQCCRNFFVQF